MRYEARVTAYDVMDQVTVSIVVQRTADTPEERPATVLCMSTTVQGEGEADPREWARDALLGMLEAL